MCVLCRAGGVVGRGSSLGKSLSCELRFPIMVRRWVPIDVVKDACEMQKYAVV